MANVLNVTDENFEAEVLKSDQPVLVDFGATWCGPCKALAPIVEELAKERAGQLKVAAIDVDKARETAVKYGIMSVPTLLFFRDGEVKNQVVGAPTKTKLEDLVGQFLG